MNTFWRKSLLWNRALLFDYTNVYLLSLLAYNPEKFKQLYSLLGFIELFNWCLQNVKINPHCMLRVFPESALKPLQKLLWLSLDNNNIDEIRKIHPSVIQIG